MRQCNVDRQKLYDCFEELEVKTGWAQLAFTGAGLVAPKLKMFLPLAGFILPRLMSKVSSNQASNGLKNIISTALDMTQKVMMVSKGLNVLPQLFSRKSA